MDTKIHTHIWADPAFIELTDSEKLGVFWALTNTNSCGYVSTSPKKISRDIETSPEELSKAMKQFGKNIHVLEHGLWFERYMREQLGKTGDKLKSSKMFSTVIKHYNEQCPSDVRELIDEKYPEVKKGASKGVTKGEGEGTGEGKGESKRGGVIKGEGVGLRSSNKERGKSELKEAVAEIAMEMEKVGAYNKSPSASCYTEYDQ